MIKIAIVGAGMTGSVLASRLSRNYDVEIFEKSHKPGGRMATRMRETFSGNHGAPFFTARSIEFQKFLKPYLDNKILVEWSPDLWGIDKKKQFFSRIWFEPHFVSIPEMTSLCNSIIGDKNVRYKHEILAIEQVPNGWRLQTETSVISKIYDWVIFCTPAPQAIKLVPSTFCKVEVLERVKMSACFSILVEVDEKKVAREEFITPVESCISSIVQSTKNLDKNGKKFFVAHATTEWSENMLNYELDEVKKKLIAEFIYLLDFKRSDLSFVDLHRWRFAFTENSADELFLIDEELAVAACGDWCLEGNVESAFISGNALSKYFMSCF